MYKLTDKEYEIKKVITPKILKELKELGLYNSGSNADEEVSAFSDLFTDTEKFKKLINIIYDKVDIEDYDSVNIAEALKGYKDFFMQLNPSLT